MIIRSCKECPFFVVTVLSMFTRGAGVCSYDKERGAKALAPFGLPDGPERAAAIESTNRQLPVVNASKVHECCPLYQGPITLTLGS